jgi:uncharacterized protein (TIGR02453 family)
VTSPLAANGLSQQALTRYTAGVTTRHTAPPTFTNRTLSFLRALKRNNDRSWFQQHRDAYEQDVRGPMVALVERAALDLKQVVPELAASPKASLYRINRDTRFTDDKSPYKTQVGAIFPHRDLPRHAGAGLYVEIGPAGTMIAGGIYMPQPPDLLALRQYLAANHGRFRTLVESPEFVKHVGPVNGESLTRVPRGFPADHPAAEFLKLKQFIFGRSYPAAFVTTPAFYRHMIGMFRRMAPVVRFLNEPLVAQLAGRDPLLERPRSR